jgi:YHS domain-containing protein
MTAIDPVCGMEVEESTAEWKTTYEGQEYYFCSPGCRRSFLKEPAKYLAAAGKPAPTPTPAHDHDHDHDHGDHAGHTHSHGGHEHSH